MKPGSLSVMVSRGTVIILVALSLMSLASCSLRTLPPPTELNPLWIRAENVNRGGNCERGWIKAKRFFMERGIEILHSDAAPVCVVCLPGLVSPIVNGLAYDSSFAVVFASPISSTQTAKYFIHEINHLLGKTHAWSGIMFPFTDVAWLATE